MYEAMLRMGQYFMMNDFNGGRMCPRMTRGKDPYYADCDLYRSSYSYARLNDEINRTANLFLTQGIEKGDRVALYLLHNCAEFIFCWFGLAKIGAVVVPVNASLLHDECAFILARCAAARLVVTTASLLSHL